MAGSRSLPLALVLGLAFPAWPNPSVDGTAHPDSAGMPRTEAGAGDSLSREELEWIEAALSPQASAANPRVVIREVRISGIDSGAHAFLRDLLPFREGDAFPEQQLDSLIGRHNQAMSGRTDLWEAYAARLTGFGDDSSRIVRVDVRPYSAGTYYGGGAFAYLGNHNRTGRGDIWGVWLGYNVNGAEWDRYLSRGWYLGAKSLYSFPLDPVADGRDWKDLTGVLRLRKNLSIPVQLHLEAGLSATFWKQAGFAGGRERELSPFLRPLLQVRFPPTRGRESAFLLDLESRLGYGLEAERGFLTSSLRCDWRHPIRKPISLAAFGRMEQVWQTPDFPTELSSAYSAKRIYAKDSLLTRAATLEAQVRLLLLRRQFGFTRMDAGPHAFAETLLAAGRGSHAALAGGGGIHFSFTAPVGVDFVLQSGYSEHGSEGYRLVTHVYF